MIKTAYNTLKQEHPLLPDFDKLNNEFNISLIESAEFLLPSIMQTMSHKIEPVMDLFERILNPDPNSFCDLYECRCYTSGEKKQILEIFRRLMEHFRLLLETELMADQKTTVETIKKIYDFWIAEKKQIVPLVKKLRESWQKNIEVKEILEYLG